MTIGEKYNSFDGACQFASNVHICEACAFGYGTSQVFLGAFLTLDVRTVRKCMAPVADEGPPDAQYFVGVHGLQT